MAVSTTQSIWRSGGGDQTRQSYCGSGVMAAQFYVPAANVAGTNVQVSSASTAPVILPAGAVVLSVVMMGGGTALETVDVGYKAVDGSPLDTNGFVEAAAADDVATILAGASGAGVVQGVALTENSYVTGGGTLTAATSGWITYFVQDPLAGQQSA